MNALIQLDNSTIDGNAVKTVNARNLHALLGSKADFSTWMKTQIDRARLVENRDFVTLTKKVERQILVDYHLTIESAKHIAMMSGTDKGFEVRDYFLECERVAHQAALNPGTMTRLQLLELAMQSEQERLKLESKVEVLLPKAEALDRISLADGTLSLSDAAKTIGVQPQKEFIPFLSAAKWIFRRAGGDHWIAYQDKLQQQLLEHKVTTVSRGDGSEKITEQVRVTPKGLAKLTASHQTSPCIQYTTAR